MSDLYTVVYETREGDLHCLVCTAPTWYEANEMAKRWANTMRCRAWVMTFPDPRQVNDNMSTL